MKITTCEALVPPNAISYLVERFCVQCVVVILLSFVKDLNTRSFEKINRAVFGVLLVRYGMRGNYRYHTPQRHITTISVIPVQVVVEIKRSIERKWNVGRAALLSIRIRIRFSDLMPILGTEQEFLSILKI